VLRSWADLQLYDGWVPDRRRANALVIAHPHLVQIMYTPDFLYITAHDLYNTGEKAENCLMVSKLLSNMVTVIYQVPQNPFSYPASNTWARMHDTVLSASLGVN